MAHDPAKRIRQAETAYLKGKNRKGDRLIEQVLAQDFGNRLAWELLHQRYGPKRSFEDFQAAFIARYYPDRRSPIEASGYAQASYDSEPLAQQKKSGSLLARLAAWTRRVRGKSSQEPIPPDVALEQTLAAYAAPAHAAPAFTAPPPVAPVLVTAAPAPQAASIAGRGASFPPDLAPGATPVAERRNGSGANEKIRVIVIDDIAQSCENIIKSLSFEPNIQVVGNAHSGTKGVQLAKETNPDVILMDINMPDMDGITATQIVREVVPAAQVVILTVQDDMDYMRRAMMAGARDFLTKPPMIDDLVSAVTRAAEFSRLERKKAQPVVDPRSPNPVAVQGKIIAIYSPKGGAGSSTLACNLAATLHSDDTPVVIVDGNLHYGDVAVMFNLQPRTSSADLAPRLAELDQDTINEALATHSSGIHVLAAPRPEHAEVVTSEQFAALLHQLSKMYPYVIADTSSTLSDVTIAALDAADLVLLVTTQDIPSLGRVRKFLELAPALEIDPKRVLLVMNKFDKRISITPERIQQSFRHTVSAVIPRELRVVLPSVNKGSPFMLQNEALSLPVAEGMLDLAKAVRHQLMAAQGEETPAGKNGKH